MSQGGAAYFAGKVWILSHAKGRGGVVDSRGRDQKKGSAAKESWLTPSFGFLQGVPNGNQEASIAGAIAGAHYIRSIAPTYGIPVVLHTDHCAKKLLPWLDGMLDEDERYFKEHGEPLFSSHMIDLSEEPVEFNIQTTANYLQRAAPLKQWLEMVSRFSSPQCAVSRMDSG